MGNQKGAHGSRMSAGGQRERRLACQSRQLGLEWPNKALDGGVGPEKEVLQVSPHWLPHRASLVPLLTKFHHLSCLLGLSSHLPSYIPKTCLPQEAFCMGLGVRLGLSKSLNFNRPPLYTHTCLCVKWEKYLPLWLY